MTQIATATSTSAAMIGTLLLAARNIAQITLPPERNAIRSFQLHTQKRTFTMSRVRISIVLLAFSASFAPLAASARGPVTLPNRPTQQLFQISGPMTPSPFGAGRAGDLPGYNSRNNSGTVVYVPTDANDIKDAAISLSN
jgi:hypothetical protein